MPSTRAARLTHNPRSALGGLFALRFPSNVSGSDTSAPFVALQFSDPAANGLPIWGTGNGGVSVVWKVRPHQQTGYYAWFWWSQGDGNIDLSATGGYWGMHPYPQNQSNTGTVHIWEVATGGGDFVTAAGNGPTGSNGTVVTKDQTYVQGMRVTRANANSKTLRFYFNFPNTDTNNYCERVETIAGYAESPGFTPPQPKITLGDSPWFAGFQHERGSHTLDAVKIMTPALSEADMIAESGDFTRMVTSAGQSAIWWGKDGFNSVDDLTCSYGTGRSFAWANANKGTLVSRL